MKRHKDGKWCNVNTDIIFSDIMLPPRSRNAFNIFDKISKSSKYKGEGFDYLDCIYEFYLKDILSLDLEEKIINAHYTPKMISIKDALGWYYTDFIPFLEKVSEDHKYDILILYVIRH